MKKHILFVEITEDGTVGGSHQAMVDTIRNLDRDRFTPLAVYYNENRHAEFLRDQGVEVWVWEETRRKEREVLTSGGRLRQVVGLAGAIARRRRFLIDRDVDLLHLNNSPAAGYDDWLPAARLAGIPIMANVMGDLRIPQSWWKSRLIKSLDGYIAISEYIRENVISEGIDPARISTIHLGVDLAAFRSSVKLDVADVRRTLGIGRDEIMIAMVGNVREWKGQHVVLEAVGLLPLAIQTRVRLYFVGEVSEFDREYRAVLENLSAQHDLKDRVTFLGARTDVSDLMNASDIIVHASVQPEPFGLVVVEGLAMAKPVVASKFGGPAEILTADSGLTFDPQHPEELADHLRCLVETPELRASLGERARERAVAFDIEPSVRGIEQVYEELLSPAE